MSNIGVKFCQTTVVNSAMLTLRGAELFLYKSSVFISVFTRYVGIVGSLIEEKANYKVFFEPDSLFVLCLKFELNQSFSADDAVYVLSGPYFTKDVFR